MNAQHPSLSSDPSGVLSPVPTAQNDRRQAMRRIAGVGALMATSIALGGCGFALRQAPTFSFDTVYVVEGLSSNVSRALQRELASVTAQRRFAEAGGLMAYGFSQKDLARRSASFLDRVLKGAKPAELPVEEPTTFDLAINLDTAKALGIAIPQSVLLRADKLIQ